MFKRRKKKAVSFEKQRSIDYSCCFTCGWRIPLHNNPTTCLWNLRNEYASEPEFELCNRPKCDMYVCDDVLSAHLKMLMRGGEKSCES